MTGRRDRERHLVALHSFRSGEKSAEVRWEIAGPGERGAIPFDRETSGVECVAGMEKPRGEGGGPPGADELQVAIRRGSVDFVTDDRMAGVGRVDADLVGPTGDRLSGEQREALRCGAGV